MAALAIITPTYAADFELCQELHRSVLDHTATSTVHHLVVPRREVELFSQLKSERCRIWSESDLLPRGMVPTPVLNRRFRLLGKSTPRIAAINLHRPLPAIRGRVAQQLLKFAISADIEADVLVLADSDVVIVRPITAETFLQDGQVRLYRKDFDVDGRHPRHVSWHKAARELLGLPPGELPFHDYISSFSAWDPKIVVALKERIELVTGRDWLEAIGAKLHISEWALYGVFVDEIVGPPANAHPTTAMLCHCHWNRGPLDMDSAITFAERLQPDDVAVLIQSASRTPLEVRRAALARVTEALEQ